MDNKIDNNNVLKPMAFTNRLKKYVLIANYLNFVSSHGNLKEAILTIQMNEHDLVVEDFKQFFVKGLSQEAINEKIKELRQTAEITKKRDIDEYLPIIFNETLIILCTVLDTFLVNSLEVITNNNPKIIKSLLKDKEFKIADLLDLASYEKIYKHVQNTVLEDFDFKGISDKLIFLEKKLNIDIAGALALKGKSKEIQDQYPDGLNFLKDIYFKRNQIVHKDTQSISNYEELSNISSYMDHFILCLGLIMGKHFHIDTDFQQFFRKVPPDITATEKDIENS